MMTAPEIVRTITVTTGHQTITIRIYEDVPNHQPCGRVSVDSNDGVSFADAADWRYVSSPVGRIELDDGHGFTSTQADMLKKVIYNLVWIHTIDF